MDVLKGILLWWLSGYVGVGKRNMISQVVVNQH